MKIAVISDPHLGYAWGTDKQEDPFVQTREALEKASESADLILLPGDIFDTRVPKQEVMEKAMHLLRIPLDASSSDARLVDSKNVPNLSEYTTAGVPVVAIHGNHERRGSMMVNPVETLSAGGLLVYLDEAVAVFEKNGERVAIHGLGAVPEPEAKKYLDEWNPMPLENAYNILVLHQSFKEMLYEEVAFLEYSDLPGGFDLYVNGHIHWNSFDENSKVLHPGSTVITQMKKRESEQPKGFYFVDTIDKSLSFVELKNQRRFFFKEFRFNKATPESVVDEVVSFLGSVPSSELRPSVKIKLKGSLQVGSVLNSSMITDKFKDSMLLAVDDELESEDFKRKIASLRELHKEKSSVLERGLDILKANLAQAKYEGVPPEKIMSALEEGDSGKALEIVLTEDDSFDWKNFESNSHLEEAMVPVEPENIEGTEEKILEPEKKKVKKKGQISLTDF